MILKLLETVYIDLNLLNEPNVLDIVQNIVGLVIVKFYD